MTRYFAVLFSGIVLCCFGQKPPIKYGEIPIEDMEMSVYPRDSSASAVVLTDYGMAFSNTRSVFERHVRIKILKKDGLRWADISIPILSAQSVTDLKATTYNLENGKITATKMLKDAVFEEKVNRSLSFQKFTLPNVKEGSIIEYSYSVNSFYMASFPNWQFQYEVPVKHSEFWAVIPDIVSLEKYIQGYIPATVYEVKYGNKFHWIFNDVPAFKAEPYMTSENDYIAKLNFAIAQIRVPGQKTQEVMSSWEKLNENLLKAESFGVIIEGGVFLKKLANDILLDETDDIKKIEKIYGYVQKTLEWDGTKDFFSDDPREVLEKKKGSCGEINLLLAALLGKADLSYEIETVLLSTRDHGFVREQYPMIRQFNYVICAIRTDKNIIFLDATDKYLPMGVLPERCLNGQGLVISKKNHGWISLDSKVKDRTMTSAELVLSNTGELNGKLTITYDGYAGVNTRKDFKTKGESDYTKNFIHEKNSTWQVLGSRFENMDDNTKSAKEIHELTITDYTQVSGDVMYLNPIIFNQLDKNPFKLESRLYPIDFGSLKDKTYVLKLILPETYQVEELPQNKLLSLPDRAGKFTYSCTLVENTLNVISNFQINKNIFTQNEYATLREFYNQVVAKQAEQIVLKKKQ